MAAAVVDDLPVTDLSDPRMVTDPHPRFAQLRREAPISRVRAPLVRGLGYLATRYDDVQTVLTDARFSSDMTAHGPARLVRFSPRLFRVLIDSMVFKDDPEHKRLRLLVNKAFTPKRVQAMADEVDRTVDQLVEQMLAAPGPVDLVEAFAVPLPLAVIANMLGISADDRDEFHRNVHAMLGSFDPSSRSALRVMGPSRRLLRLFDKLAAERRADPDDGLISALIRANEGDDRLRDDEIISMMFLLLLAGHDTTSNLIGAGTVALLDLPDQLERLRDDPALTEPAVEELLRYTSPVPAGTTRYLLDDIELSGVSIPKGSQVIGVLASANRDEEVFVGPDDLDLGRDPNRHLAFAFGPHFCLGAQVARLEARAAFRALADRFASIQLAMPRDEIRIKTTPNLRGPVSVALRVRGR
jgi:cytochrome P450